jgi:hypothetical protein
MLANVKELCIISELEKATNFLASSNHNELEVRMTDLPNTKLIPLTQGKFAIVDAEDYDFLMQWSWQAKSFPVDKSVFYAKRDNKGKHVYMHRVLIKASKGEIVDHVNRNPLDNRKCNLRLCTISQNAYNRKKVSNNTSGYKGVGLIKGSNKWWAKIKVNKTSIHLGAFNCPIEAAKAYDEAATKHHGEFALTNKMLGLIKD